MKITKIISKSLALLAIIGTLGIAPMAMAHETPCPYCKMKVVQNTKEMDNEVVLKVGNKRIEYRCVYCVIKDQKKYSGDLIVYAPSEKKGEPIILKRTGGKWTAPEGTVFLNGFTKHADCAALSRAFTSKAALDKYAASHKVADAKALTLAKFLEEVSKPAK